MQHGYKRGLAGFMRYKPSTGIHFPSMTVVAVWHGWARATSTWSVGRLFYSDSARVHELGNIAKASAHPLKAILYGCHAKAQNNILGAVLRVAWSTPANLEAAFVHTSKS